MKFFDRFQGMHPSRATIVAVVFVVAMVTGGAFVQRGARGGPPTAFEAARLFDNVRAHIAREYVEDVDDVKLYRMAVEGLLAELGDPYTQFLSPERMQRISEETSGNYAGVGLQVDIRDGWIVVIAPVPGGPAERAGIQTGDRVLEIDGKSTQDWTTEEASRALRGRAGSPVTLVIDRTSLQEPFAVSFTRGSVHQSAVRRTAMLTRDIGYVELKIFSDSTLVELRRATENLRRQGMRTLVLDVRVNPGGLLSQGVRVAELFLDRGDPVVKIRGRTPDANRDFVDSAPELWPQLPLIVLVDGRSASAAEIVAGALQDHDRAAIIGQPTYGKGSAQAVFPIADEGAVKMTTARWYTPLGRSIQKVLPRDDFGEFDQEEESDDRPKFRTNSGRTVLGGGGIVPDLLAGDTAEAPETRALQHALGAQGRRFRDAVTDYALAAKRSRKPLAPDFPVTTDMVDDLWEGMRRRGIAIERGVYDDASPWVSRVLAYEVARYVFGPEAEFRRRAADDPVIKVALAAAVGARDAHDLVQRVERMGSAAERESRRE